MPEVKGELFRCKIDWRLLTWPLIRRGWCAGHHVMQPAYANPWERLLLSVGLYDRFMEWTWPRL